MPGQIWEGMEVVFGRKIVQRPYLEAEFAGLVRNFDRTRIIRNNDARAEANRLRLLADATPAEIENIPNVYGRRITAAKQALDAQIDTLNQYLKSTSISTRVVPLMIIGPSVWKGTPLSNFLIYSLGLTPFDPWNQILAVDNPIGSADLGMGYFRAEAEEMLAADFCKRYQMMIDDWDLAEKAYERKRDIEVLMEFAEISRKFIDGDARQIRRTVAWKLYGGAGVEPQFY